MQPRPSASPQHMGHITQLKGRLKAQAQQLAKVEGRLKAQQALSARLAAQGRTSSVTWLPPASSSSCEQPGALFHSQPPPAMLESKKRR